MLWDAPTPTGPLNAVVEVPGSKSQTNRLLILAALADSPSVIHGALRSRDTDLMIAALNTLGASIVPGDSPSTLLVEPISFPTSRTPDSPPLTIDVGLAGTVMRFVPPVAALVGGRVTFDGDAGARVRPMKGLMDALEKLGVSVTYHGEPGFLPFTVEHYGDVVAPGAADGGEHGPLRIDSRASSQFISGLLLAAPRFKGGLALLAEPSDDPAAVPSRPHIDMTVAELLRRGAWVDPFDPREPNEWVVFPQTLAWDGVSPWVDGVSDQPISHQIRGGEMWVEPDLSNAAPFLAAALVAGGSVTVPGWPTETTQPGGMVPKLLQRMGACVSLDDGNLTVSGFCDDAAPQLAQNDEEHPAFGTHHPSPCAQTQGLGHNLSGIEVDLSAAGELAPTFVALAALASGPSRFTGIAHLRGHETDRLAALVTEINRLGGEARELPDGIEVNSKPLHTRDIDPREINPREINHREIDHRKIDHSVWHTYDDHRMATAGAIIGLRVPGVKVENIETTAKTLPGFAEMWAAMMGLDSSKTPGMNVSNCSETEGGA